MQYPKREQLFKQSKKLLFNDCYDFYIDIVEMGLAKW
jgi:hypothetical protein